MRWIALTLICLAATGVAATAATARTETLITAKTGPTAPIWSGLGDTVFQSSQATTAYTMASQIGTKYARLFVHWNAIAPSTLPASGFVPTDPASPYYHWAPMDSSVAAANAAGITPILTILGTPSWAYHVQPAGAFKAGQPDITKLGQFATAVAARYHGSSPSAHVFSLWNEANFNRNLYPQSATYYRSMVNAVSDSVHAVDAANLMAAGELAPFKHVPSGLDKNNVTAPITWMQQMFCLSNTTPVHKTTPCTPVKIDVWTHHPYSDKGPFGKASVSGGVELGDLPKMKTLLQTAWSLGTIDAANPPQFWVTEVGWSSKPPNKHGVPMALLTRWLPESFYQMWKSGVTVGTWYLLQDAPYPSTPYQSGLYLDSASLSNAVAKPLRNAFNFPLVAYRKSLGKVLVWGRVTTYDVQDVAIQEKLPSKPWKTVATITSNNYGIFTATLNLHAQTTWQIRAIAPGSGTSTVFKLAVPSNENMSVVPFPAG